MAASKKKTGRQKSSRKQTLYSKDKTLRVIEGIIHDEAKLARLKKDVNLFVEEYKREEGRGSIISTEEMNAVKTHRNDYLALAEALDITPQAAKNLAKRAALQLLARGDL